MVGHDGRVIKETKTSNGLSVDGMSYNTTFKEFFFYLQSFTISSVLYKLDLDTFNYDLVNQTKVGFNPKGYKFIKKTFMSKDGAEVPITIVYKDSLSQNYVTPFLMSIYVDMVV
ncbi:MAG: prolyl oligopeptidase PreP (S9A serine peptidase family) [Psychroserpens sp.]